MAIDKQLIVKLGLEVKDWLKSTSQLDSSTKNFNNQLNKLLATSKNTFLVAESLIDSTNKKFKKLEAQISSLNEAAKKNNDTINKQAASIAKLKASLDKANNAKQKQLEQLNKLKQAKEQQKAAEQEEIKRKKSIEQALKQVSGEIKRGLAESKKAQEEQDSIDKALFKAKLNRIKLNSDLIKTKNALELRLVKEREAFITSSETSLGNLVKRYLDERSRLAKQVAADTIKAESQMAASVKKHLNERRKLAELVASDTIKAENEMAAIVKKHFIDRDNDIRKTAIANNKAEREMAAIVQKHLKEQEALAKAVEDKRIRGIKRRKKRAEEALRAEAREAKKTAAALKRLERETEKARKRWGIFASKLAGGVGNIASKLRQFEIIFDAVFNGKLREAIDNFAAFDASVRASMGLLPEAQQNIKGFSKDFTRLAEEFGTLPIDQSKAFYKAISNRLPPDAAIAMLPIANKMAIATQSELVDVVKAGTDVMNGFDAELSSLPKIYNSMANAVRTGQVTLDDFNTKLGDVIPVARAAGVGLDEMLAILAELTIGGKNPAIALTQMKRLFVGVSAPTKEAAGAFRQFNIDTSRARVESEGFVSVLKDINEVTAGDPDRLKEFLPNIRALGPALQLMQDNLKGIGQTTKEQIANSNAFAQAYKVNAEGASRDIKKLQASVRAATNQMGEDFIRLGQTYTESGTGVKDLQKSLKSLIGMASIIGQSFTAAFLTLGRVFILLKDQVKNAFKTLFSVFELFAAFVVNTFENLGNTVLAILSVAVGGVLKAVRGVITGLAAVDSKLGGLFAKKLNSATGALDRWIDKTEEVSESAKENLGFEDTKQAFFDLLNTGYGGLNDLSNNVEELGLLWEPVNKSIKEYNLAQGDQVVLGRQSLEVLKRGSEERKKTIEEEKNIIRARLEGKERLALAMAKVAVAAKAAAKAAKINAKAQAKADRERVRSLKKQEAALKRMQREKERANKAAARERARVDKQIAREQAKRDKAEAKAAKKQSDLLKKLAGDRTARRTAAQRASERVNGLNVDSPELAGVDAEELAKKFGSFQRTNKIFINENIVAVRRLINGSVKVVLEESQAAFLRRKNEFRDTTVEATDGIVQGLQQLADQISPVVAQLTFDSDKLGRDAIRRSDDALRSSPFFNQAAGGLGARAQANFAFRTGAFSGFSSGGSVGIKRFANGGPSTPLPNVDSVPALLTPGEFVINKESAAAFLPALQRINRTSGGNVSSVSNNSTQNNTFNFSGSGGITPDQVRREIIPVIRAQERMGRK